MLIMVVKGVNAVPRILSDPSFEMYRPYLAWDLDSDARRTRLPVQERREL